MNTRPNISSPAPAKEPRGDVTISWNTGEVHRTYANGRSRHFPSSKPINPPKAPKGSS